MYNVDKIPLYLIVPEEDKDLFVKELQKQKEEYDFYIDTDENI